MPVKPGLFSFSVSLYFFFIFFYFLQVHGFHSRLLASLSLLDTVSVQSTSLTPEQVVLFFCLVFKFFKPEALRKRAQVRGAKADARKQAETGGVQSVSSVGAEVMSVSCVCFSVFDSPKCCV